ncbi:Uma2 family endonuclease [Streptomyces griseoviridis]|jgi:Uma2 family endonuclease|uniref:Uma2 family endonuclease n=2 Tax=Streptomyces TaxID=1883 RepID=A0ABT9LIY3_STRGD|nr:Uma2 family endonuclease [Streptomyces griseoviridis]
MDTDADDHLIESNSYDPICFRLVLEVTSSNYRTDLRTKVLPTHRPRFRSM